MKSYSYLQPPFEIHGLAFFPQNGLSRFPISLIEQVPGIRDAAERTTGARLLFRTDSKMIRIEIKVSNVYVDRGFSFYESNVGAVFIGEHTSARFAGILTADNSYDSEVISGDFQNDGMNTVTVFLPHKPKTQDITIYLDDEATVLSPAPFHVEKPFLFYGSSITENGHCGIQNGYTELLGRMFGADYYNFGLSGSARGELPLADYFGSIEHSLFVYDYDHNAPTVEHLEQTHYAFYRQYRQHCPTTPVIMMTRPAYDDPTSSQRLEVVKSSYQKGVAQGDSHLYFIDGLTLFDSVDPNICTTDRTHPNGLGHYLMAQTVAKVIQKILSE